MRSKRSLQTPAGPVPAAASRPSSARQSGSPVVIKAGISDAVNTALAWYMARAAGLYAARGLDVDILNMHGGSRGAGELQAGRIDVMHVGLSSVIRVNRAGGDLRVIGSLANVIRFAFFSAPGVNKAADLAGGSIGVSTLGSETDSTATLALQKLGLSRGDVAIKELGGSENRLRALKSGQIKATALNEPVASLAREAGVNVLVDLVADGIPWLFSGIVVRRDDIGTRRDLLMRFLRASIEANYIARSDEKRAKLVLAEELKITDAKILGIVYDDFRKQSPANLEPSAAGARNVLAQFPDHSQAIGDYLDTSLIEALEGEGYFAAMQQKYEVAGV